MDSGIVELETNLNDCFAKIDILLENIKKNPGDEKIINNLMTNLDYVKLDLDYFSYEVEVIKNENEKNIYQKVYDKNLNKLNEYLEKANKLTKVKNRINKNQDDLMIQAQSIDEINQQIIVCNLEGIPIRKTSC